MVTYTAKMAATMTSRCRRQHALHQLGGAVPANRLAADTLAATTTALHAGSAPSVLVQH